MEKWVLYFGYFSISFEKKKYVIYTEILSRKVELWIFSLVSLRYEKRPQNNFSRQNSSVENNNCFAENGAAGKLKRDFLTSLWKTSWIRTNKWRDWIKFAVHSKKDKLILNLFLGDKNGMEIKFEEDKIHLMNEIEKLNKMVNDAQRTNLTLRKGLDKTQQNISTINNEMADR